MMNELLMLGGSLLLVGLVVGLVHLMRLGGGSIASDEQAADLAEAFSAGFHPGMVLRDKEGRAALVAEAGGNGFVLMKQGGSHASGRFLTKPKIEERARHLVIDSEDRWFGPVSITPENDATANSMIALVRQRGAV